MLKPKLDTCSFCASYQWIETPAYSKCTSLDVRHNCDVSHCNCGFVCLVYTCSPCRSFLMFFFCFSFIRFFYFLFCFVFVCLGLWSHSALKQWNNLNLRGSDSQAWKSKFTSLKQRNKYNKFKREKKTVPVGEFSIDAWMTKTARWGVTQVHVVHSNHIMDWSPVCRGEELSEGQQVNWLDVSANVYTVTALSVSSCNFSLIKPEIALTQAVCATIPTTPTHIVTACGWNLIFRYRVHAECLLIVCVSAHAWV